MKNWLSAIRLRTLPLAGSCTLMGSALGWHDAQNPWLIFALALTTTFLLQILSNLANDYGDYMNGVDNDARVGPKRTMQSESITKAQMKIALTICTAFTLISGLSLLWISLGHAGLFYYALAFLIIGLLAIAAAFKYTMGKNPYGYKGLGDLFVFIFFGIVGVFGTYFLFSQQWNAWILLPASSIGLLCCAVLNLNNMRDHKNDAANGKRTIVVIIGFEKARVYHAMLILFSFLLLVFYGFYKFCKNIDLEFPIKWFCVLPFFILFSNIALVLRVKNPAALDPELKAVALSTFFVALIFFVCVLI